MSQSAKIPDNLEYTREHIWLASDGMAGITDYAQNQLGEIVFVDLPEPGSHFKAGEEFGSIESAKAVNGLFMPVSGEIIAINEALADAPEIVNEDSYGKGWLIRIKPDGKPDKLLSAEDYKPLSKA